jgi:hypothetical protein
MVCPQIVSTDLDDLWLLCILGEAESTGTSERDMENSFLRNDAVFPPALCKHGQVGNSADSREPLLRWSLATGHAADILDEYDPDVGYDPETFP